MSQSYTALEWNIVLVCVVIKRTERWSITASVMETIMNKHLVVDGRHCNEVIDRLRYRSDMTCHLHLKERQALCYI